MRKSILSLMGLLVVLSLVLAACAPAATPTPEVIRETVEVPVEVPVEVTVEVPVEVTPVPGERVPVRWFIGLGTGQNPEQMPVEEAAVAGFNAAQDKINLTLEIVSNDIAFDVLRTEISAGNAPDIVGPVGVRGSNEFVGVWLDLDPLLADYDVSGINPGALDAWRVPGEGLIGLPIGVYPSMIYYNRDLFDEAGLDYPPHTYGEPYADGDEWTIEKMEELAMLLTVDANGNDATSPDFDPEKIVQFGYHSQWTDPRGDVTLFGAGSFVDADGNATIPDHWREAFHWYYDGMWEKYFMPNLVYQESDLMAAGNPFNSGNVAMAHCHLWYTCCLGDVPNWDMAAIPSYMGTITAKLHTDMVGVLNTTEHPEEAVEVLYSIITNPELLEIWGALPAVEALQAGFLAGLDEKYPIGVDWQVAIDGLSYPDIPNHESNMPNFAEADDRVKAFESFYESTAGLDMDAEIDKFLDELQGIFEAAE